MIRTNIRALKSSRKQPERGDVFVMQLPNERYLFGRVVLANVPQGSAPMPGANLIYIYDYQSSTPTPNESKLLPARLLIPPVWTNSLGWTKGCFQTISNLPLSDFDVLRQHCFRRVAVTRDAQAKYVNERGTQLKHRSEPCGEWGLVSYRWIDDHVSDAIGIPRVPEEIHKLRRSQS